MNQMTGSPTAEVTVYDLADGRVRWSRRVALVQRPSGLQANLTLAGSRLLLAEPGRPHPSAAHARRITGMDTPRRG